MASAVTKMKDPPSAKDQCVIQEKLIDLLNQKKSSDVKNESSMKSTNEDVQRAIEGLKEIPDEELQEFLDDEDFMKGLDVVDAWEGDEEKNREADRKVALVKEREQKHLSRDKHRRDRKGSYSRERPKREDKKHEEVRRDPSKSTKDIERDKIRTKRDNESKLLAEKEKAIKHLLDSDNVVPPGTEVEAIQSITERQNQERAQMHVRRSRERRRSVERQTGSSLRRRSVDRVKLSPVRRRTPLILSPERRRSPFKISVERHRSPIRLSPEKRRSPPRFNCDRRSPFAFSPERRRSPIRRLSWERRTSPHRKWSAERHRRRVNVHERRRSRSRDRQRSRSLERIRRKTSRSPVRRYSPRRRSRTRSRSVERRVRKRSPFINELARQLRNEAMMTTHLNPGYTHHPQVEGIQPLLNTVVYSQETENRPPIPITPFIHPPVLSTPLPPGVAGTGPNFINFENPAQAMTFDPPALHTLPQVEYSSGPVMYNQGNATSTQLPHRPALLPTPVLSPQPVPAPVPVDHVQISYNSSHATGATRRSPSHTFEYKNRSANITVQTHKERKSTTPYNGYPGPKEERLKTPEPPVISDTKQFEKTSLSSLLEASVSAKDSTGLPVLYPGFKPEILRHCEHALRELPLKDPRLQMKGRFFYDSNKEDVQSENKEHSSNSILLQKGKSKMYWEEEDVQNLSPIKQSVQTHQKICQTDEVETDTKSIQAAVTMVDFEAQVYPQDLQEVIKEEKKPIMDRLDWNMRETFDYTPKYREADDLRWSLSNSSQKRSWSRTVSPSRRSDDHEHRLDPISTTLDRNSRTLKLGSPVRSRDSFSGHKGSVREHYVRERYSPDYRHSTDERDDFQESRSDHSRCESPLILQDSDEELEVEHTFQRESDWHGRGRPLRGRSNSLIKTHVFRGKHPGGRSYRGRGNFRGKF